MIERRTFLRGAAALGAGIAGGASLARGAWADEALRLYWWGTPDRAARTQGVVELFQAAHPGAPTGPCVLLTMTDTGLGMDELVRTQIFEPFFTTKEPGKGTGLGLAIAFDAVRRHRGSIEARNRSGGGLEVELRLPID